jgi:hypothetical protein
MPVGRTNKVLFDLIPQRAQVPSGSSAPLPVAPVPVGPVPVAPVPVAPQPVPTAPLPPSDQPATGSRPGSSRGQTSSPAAKPTLRVELKPAEVLADPPSALPASRPSRSRDADSANSASAATARAGGLAIRSVRWPAFLGTNAVAVPITLFGIALAVILFAGFALYSLGVSVGEGRATANLAALSGANAVEPPIEEPAASAGVGGVASLNLPPTPANTPRANPSPRPDANASPSRAGSSAQPPRAQPPRTAGPALPGTIPEGGIITSKGVLLGDPREAELNYLSLASLGEEDAIAAVAFLSANGVESIAVPTGQTVERRRDGVDRDAQGGNNQGPVRVYQLFALPGITREEFSQKRTARTNLEAAVARVGATWQRDHRGASNFARTQWVKYRP